MKNKKKIELDTFQETKVAKKYKNLQFTVILIQPEHSGNIGSIARIMANFEFTDLVLFNPLEKLEKIFSYETQGFAMHGKNILFKAQVIQIKNELNHFNELTNLLNEFDFIIATTAKGRKYTNLTRSAIFPEDFNLPISDQPLKIAVIFGRESRGLTNDEMNLADIILRIPTSESYPTLNISHACGIILYELFIKLNDLKIGSGKKPVLLADREERQLLLTTINSIIKKIKIRYYKKNNVYLAFKHVFERSLITKKELSLILGVLLKFYSLIENRKLYDE